MPDDPKTQHKLSWDALTGDNTLPRREKASLRKRFRSEIERKRLAGLKDDADRNKLRV